MYMNQDYFININLHLYFSQIRPVFFTCGSFKSYQKSESECNVGKTHRTLTLSNHIHVAIFVPQEEKGILSISFPFSSRVILKYPWLL